MLQVVIAILLGFKRQNKTMRETLIALLVADIGAPFQGFDSRNLFLQRGERLFDLLYLVSRRRAFEFKTNNMVDLPCGGRTVRDSNQYQ